MRRKIYKNRKGRFCKRPMPKRKNKYRNTTPKKWKRKISGVKEIVENAASFIPGIGETQAALGIARGLKKIMK